MKEKITELIDRFDEGNMSINDLEQELLVLYDVSKHYIVCTDINYKNELVVISHEFADIEDAELFKKHCLETEKYKGKTLLILNVC